MAASTDGTIEGALGRLAISSTDEQAWADLVRQTWPYVRQAAVKHLGPEFSSSLADDVAQDVFLRLSRAAHAGRLRWPRTQAECFTLMQVVTRNRALDLLRRVNRKRRDAHRDVHPATLDGVAASEQTGIARVDARDFAAELRRRLDPFDQAILDLILRDFRPAEVADALDTSLKTIRRHLRTIRQIAERL